MEGSVQVDYCPGGALDHEDSRHVAHSRSFLHRLGCMSEHAQRLQGTKCKLVVNEKFTITEFKDGGHNMASSSIRINDAKTLSLDPEMIGTVLKIDFVGLPVSKMGTAGRVLSSGLVGPRKRQEAWSNLQGFRVEAFKRSFRQHIEQRARQHFLPQVRMSKRYISAARAHALMEEHLNGEKYNWAENRADHIRRGISNACGKSGRGDLSTSVKAILASYIAAALAFLGGLEQGSDPHHGKTGKKRPRAGSLRRKLKDEPTSTSTDCKSSPDGQTESGRQPSGKLQDHAPSDEHSGSDSAEEEDTHCDWNASNPADSNSFFRGLGCVTKQTKGELQGGQCELEVNDEYTICGFQDGGSSDEAPSFSSIKVNCVLTGHDALALDLSLEPEMMGKVLGMEFEGLPVAVQVDTKKVLGMVAPEKRAAARAGRRNGYKCSYFPPEFQAYMGQRQKELCLPVGYISGARAYSLYKEFFSHVKFNWAKERADYLVQALRTGVREMGMLAPTAKSLLTTYIAAALPLLKGGLRSSYDTDVQQQLRRSSRNMSSKRKKSDPAACCEDRQPKRMKEKKASAAPQKGKPGAKLQAEAKQDAAPAAVHRDQRIGHDPSHEMAQVEELERKDTNYTILVRCYEILVSHYGDKDRINCGCKPANRVMKGREGSRPFSCCSTDASVPETYLF